MLLHRTTARLAGLAVLLANTLLAGSASRADAPPAVVVARVGSHAITAAELERRIANIPAFQLRSFGKTPEAIRKSFLENVLVREALFAEGARAAGMAGREEVSERIRGVLRNTLVAQMRAQAASASAVTDQDVRAYYEANARKFHTPARLALWRIQVATQGEAASLLGALEKDLSPRRFSDLAREKSLDKTTNLRGGNLGFVEPSGATGEPGVGVDHALFDAASRVKDSELVPEPVKDGSHFSVVWRRQSMKAVDRPLEMEAASIRQILAHQRAEASLTTALAALRKQHVTELLPELVDLIDISSSGELSALQRPGVLPLRRGAAPRPTTGSSGLR